MIVNVIGSPEKTHAFLAVPWDGLMRKGDRKDENGERILIWMIHRILIDNTATYQYGNIVKPFTNLMEGGFMPGTLTKADIIAAVQSENGYSLQKSADTVETLIETIKSILESGEDVLASGFRRFCVKDKRERRGRNPATDEDMALPARRVVSFKCSGKLRDRINDSYGEKL